MMLAFILLGALAIAGGILTIAAKNAVHAALGLVGTLICVAGLFATMNASFLAATQVIVYAGAIMVLFLFVIMLLGANQPVTARDPLPFVGPLGAIAALLLAGGFVTLVLTYQDPRPLAEARLKIPLSIQQLPRPRLAGNQVAVRLHPHAAHHVPAALPHARLNAGEQRRVILLHIRVNLS